MKKLSYLLAVAAIAVAFTGCKKDDDGPNLNNVVEDGFYVAGAATGSEELAVDYRMSAGTNEVTKEARDGMYEKYVALVGGQDFYLFLKDGENETRYSATLENVDLTGDGDQPGSVEEPFTIYKGSLLVGNDAAAMRVTESGLYHIVLDLNKSGDLDLTGGAQIIIAPVQWGLRGVNGDWGTVYMTAGDFNQTTMTWTKEFETTNSGEFKFAYGGGWKIQLDDAGNVKAETNLGEGCVSGGDNIAIQKGENVTISLTWTLKSGKIADGFSYNVDGTWIIEDPSTFVFSLIGSAFNNAEGTAANWDYDIDLAYQADLSTVADQQTKDGTYVYTGENIELIPGDFKIRKDHDWGVNFGYSAANITGNDVANFTDNSGNITVTTGGTYNIKFTYTQPSGNWELELNNVAK